MLWYGELAVPPPCAALRCWLQVAPAVRSVPGRQPRCSHPARPRPAQPAVPAVSPAGHSNWDGRLTPLTPQPTQPTAGNAQKAVRCESRSGCCRGPPCRCSCWRPRWPRRRPGLLERPGRRKTRRPGWRTGCAVSGQTERCPRLGARSAAQASLVGSAHSCQVKKTCVARPSRSNCKTLIDIPRPAMLHNRRKRFSFLLLRTKQHSNQRNFDENQRHNL